MRASFKFVILFLLVVMVAIFGMGLPAFAQSGLSKVAGDYVADKYQAWGGSILVGNTATGSQTITIQLTGTLPDGRNFPPPVSGASLSVDLGANNETVVLTGVSSTTCPTFGSQCYAITASFSNTHGATQAKVVATATGGLQEAVTDAGGAGGGHVVVYNDWSGTDAMFALVVPNSNVVILDKRVSAAGLFEGVKYWTVQPTTLSALATPATRSASAGATQVISGTAVGTWTAVTTFPCVTYVDILGQESPCSASFSFTATASVALNFAAPAASTGAVGWKAYAGITGTSTQYQLPITAANCPLTTLETVQPACAMGSAGVFPTPSTTTSLIPTYVVNTYQKNTQSHTTFAYQPSAKLPSICSPESNFGPFTATTGGTTGQIQVLGSVPLTSGCLNQISRAIRVSFKIAMTNGTAETPQYLVQLGPSFTTGTPTTICKIVDTTALTAAANSVSGSCIMVVNATGASGTIMPDGFAITQLQAGTTAGAGAADTGTAAITNSLSGQDTLYITYIGTSGTSTAAQLLSLNIEDL